MLTLGGKNYAAIGTAQSTGPKLLSLDTAFQKPGIYEVAMGTPLEEIFYELAGGFRLPVKAVQVGGPLGAYFPASMLDVKLDYEALAAAKGLLGHGGITVFDDTVDLAKQARFAFEFCAIESCGKCTPCRIGATRGVETMDRVIAGVEPTRNLALVKDLCEVMTDGSLCAMGGLTPIPVMSALTHFPEDFEKPAAHAIAAE